MPGGHCGTRRGRLEGVGRGREINISPNPALQPPSPDSQTEGRLFISPPSLAPNPHLVLAVRLPNPIPRKPSLVSISEPLPTPNSATPKIQDNLQNLAEDLRSKLHNLNLRTGRSQEVILVNVLPTRVSPRGAPSLLPQTSRQIFTPPLPQASLQPPPSVF